MLERVVDVVAELGRDDDFVALTGERSAEHSLAVPGAVVGGGVEERDAELECSAEGAHRTRCRRPRSIRPARR